jgi:hypothetical protein
MPSSISTAIPMARSSFFLHKWYLDAVDANGQFFIGYWATLRWGWLRLHYHGYLLQLGTQPVQRMNRFHSIAPPQLTGERLNWQVQGIRGTWHRTVAPIQERLLETEAGCVDWMAHQPRARVTFKLSDETQLTGLGYVEELRMTLPPWKLPIQRLHWGRSLAEDHAAVWIRWESSEAPLNLVWWSDALGQMNCERQQVMIEPNKVGFPEHCLKLYDTRLLRSGSIGQTVFQRLGWARCLFPRTIQNLMETKWLSRSSLECNEGLSAGWAIHEVVDW